MLIAGRRWMLCPSISRFASGSAMCGVTVIGPGVIQFRIIRVFMMVFLLAYCPSLSSNRHGASITVLLWQMTLTVLTLCPINIHWFSTIINSCLKEWIPLSSEESFTDRVDSILSTSDQDLQNLFNPMCKYWNLISRAELFTGNILIVQALAFGVMCNAPVCMAVGLNVSQTAM